MAKSNVRASDCLEAIRKAVSNDELSDKAAQKILDTVKSKAIARAEKKGMSLEEALQEIEGEIVPEAALMDSIMERNRLLQIQAIQNMKKVAKRFPTVGLGMAAFLEGSHRQFKGARNSVDAQADALQNQYLGMLLKELDKIDGLDDLTKGTMDKDIWIEMGNRGSKNVGSTGNKKAAKIAEIIDTLYDEVISHQNSVGSYIKRLPGYIIRQTHDRQALRALGGPGNSRSAAFNAWYDDTLDLLDLEKTFDTSDLTQVRAQMEKIHEGLYSGHHGSPADPAELMGFTPTLNIAKKTSQRRILHFKDAEAAYKYNEMFGIKRLSDSIFSDLHFRSRNITLMKNMGPNPQLGFDTAIRQLKDELRGTENSAAHMDSLQDSVTASALKMSWAEVSGFNAHPENLSAARMTGNIQSMLAIAKMGMSTMSSLGDKAMLQVEMAFQGISGLDTMLKQITGMFGRDTEGLRVLRALGVGMDGIQGSTMSRYALNDTASGWATKLQQKFFDLNFLNWWTDRNKASAGELMAHHLGDQADVKWGDLEPETRKVLNLYELDDMDWDAMRSTVWKKESGEAFIIPDEFNKIPDTVIDGLLARDNLNFTKANRKKARRDLNSKYRTYIADRVDHAVPTPGAAQRKWLNMGTKAGTPLGVAMRLLTMFKGFPITVFTKVLGRDVFDSAKVSASPRPVREFLASNHKGKFRVAQLVAMTTIGGYVSGAIKDALKGRKPKELITDGKVNLDTFNDAMLRGGGLGIFGDFLFSEYDQAYRSVLNTMAGPVFGQLPLVTTAATKAKGGEFPGRELGKLTKDNTPYINLFYIRPILDYLVLWNLQEMLDPGSLKRMEDSVRTYNNQGFFVEPSKDRFGQ